MYCVMCGTQNPDYAKFCRKCGSEIVTEHADDITLQQESGSQTENIAPITEESLPLPVLPPDNEANLEAEKCPICGEMNGILWDGKCLSCLSAPDTNNEQPIVKICPKCGNAFSGEGDVCPYCHKEIMQIDPEGVWICPECYEENLGIYTVCSSCGYRLTQEDNPPIVEVGEEDNGWTCRRCGSKNVDYDNVCFYCGTKKGEEVTPMNSNKQHNGTGCYRHPERQAVAQCPNCGAFMCRECYNRYEGHMCKNCTYENNKAYISRIRTSLIWAAVFLVLGWIIGGAAVGSGGFLIGLWAAGLPGGFVFSGWDVFATMDMGCLGMVFYWIFRLLAASVVGLILTIINIFRLVRAISVQRELEDMDIWD